MDIHFHNCLKVGILLFFLTGTGSCVDRRSSRTERYIMKSYFEKYESLDDTNFQEFISHGLPFGLCELLQSNPDLLRLAVPRRLLIGEGSHRHLSSSIKFHIEPESVSQLPSHFCKVLIVERLPSGVFADPFELQHLLERGVFTDVAVFGDTNLELPSILSNRSAIEVHMDLGPNMLLGHKKELDVNIELPVHARYPPLDESGYSTVEFGTPDIILHCSIEGKSRNRRCLFIPTIDGADTNTEPVFWRIPSGRIAHARIVFVLTFISASISTLLIVWTSIYHSNTRNSKNAKLS
ncbi:uncharacterized protein LOC120017256 isoform X2 [Tripterygium wilfordii]|uniref:uncharacterized protein LOC120017256 isoform X2 n=1 Tax=Tripterygium wilfordii TaxID=458696 RepID=UPI0018F85C74|nr:uncharacterized protein LOC120017256 isoform X2 [Tripterygium wilfordii]